MLVSWLFLWIFCEKILIYLIIMLECHSWLSESIVFWFLKVFGISWNVIPYWNDVSKRDINLNQLDDCSCSSSIWRSKSMVHSVLFKSWYITLKVCFAALGKLLMIFDLVWSIAFDTLRSLSSVQKSHMSLLLAVFILSDSQVYVCTSNSSNIVFYIETFCYDRCL